MITRNAIMKAAVLPVALVTAEDIFSKLDLLFFCFGILPIGIMNRQATMPDDLFVLETD